MSQKQEQEHIMLRTANRWRTCLGSGGGSTQPTVERLGNAPSFWAFTFSYAAVASDAMRWIEFEHPIGGIFLGSMLLAAITLLIGGIAFRSLIALRQGTFLPAS